ncbi:hypothetical protein DY000_02018983 [Brassica cretica]|uniref:Uncharacterized protein n=1 Tax=Brassica cretica TaxID=69181 RepID=A0ABQ7CR68_BRACR|nr:hypothetical protein DY000_02018983 [Brassica cretica]
MYLAEAKGLLKEMIEDNGYIPSNQTVYWISAAFSKPGMKVDAERFGSKQDIYCDFTTGVGAGEIMAHHHSASLIMFRLLRPNRTTKFMFGLVMEAIPKLRALDFRRRRMEASGMVWFT